MQDCLVCTKELRHLYTCSECDFVCCVTCVTTFINISTQCICMHCKKQIEFNDAITTNSNKFIKVFKKFKENELFQTEMSKMIDTQPYYLYKVQISYIEKDIKNQEKLLVQIYRDYHNSPEFEKNAFSKTIQNIKKDIHDKYFKIHSWKHHYQMDCVINRSATVIRSCPDYNCNGYVSEIQNTNHCGVCRKSFCKICYNLYIDDTHCCSENDIKCIQAIQQTTKPCPTCNIPIQKIHGCDQMWCVQCKSAFLWEVGTVIQGYIHNPHYAEYIEDSHKIFVDISQLQTTYKIQTKLSNCHKFIITIYDYFIYKPIPTQNFNTNLDLRMKWIAKQIQTKDFKHQIYKRHKKYQVKSHIYENIMTLIHNINNVFKLMVTTNSVTSYISDIDGHIHNFNQYMTNYKLKVNNKTPHISFVQNDYILNNII